MNKSIWELLGQESPTILPTRVTVIAPPHSVRITHNVVTSEPNPGLADKMYLLNKSQLGDLAKDWKEYKYNIKSKTTGTWYPVSLTAPTEQHAYDTIKMEVTYASSKSGKQMLFKRVESNIWEAVDYTTVSF